MPLTKGDKSKRVRSGFRWAISLHHTRLNTHHQSSSSRLYLLPFYHNLDLERKVIVNYSR